MAKIIVAEDEALVRCLVCEELVDVGHIVLPVSSGDEAAALLEGEAGIDLLFTDISMPGVLDGWALGKLASEILPGIRIIYATGYSKDAWTLQPHERLLHKPFVFQQVAESIASLGL